MQGNLGKVGPNAGELMEGGPECRGTYGRLAQVQGNLWTGVQKVGTAVTGGVGQITFGRTI